jgi:DNA-binding LacI/PurR family transcriptional regulator
VPRTARPAPPITGRTSRIHDVAQAAGVSTATVSRALRGLDRVSPETRARVEAAAAELRYVASPQAASLKSGKTSVIAVVVPFLTRWFFAQLMDGAESVLRTHGYHLLLFTIGRGERRTQVLDSQLLAKRVDGVLVLSADLDRDEVVLLRGLQLPIVTVGLDLPGCDRVGIDDVSAAQTAMTHLLELGHTCVAYIGGDPAEDVHMATAIDRLAGVRAALDGHGVRLPAPYLRHGDWTVRGGVVVADALLDLPERPTALLAASDEMAIGALYAARRRGISVPAELSVIGIDDHEMSFTHDLSTVRQSVPELGVEAAELLLDALSGRSRSRRRQVILPTELVLRGSTARPARPSPRRHR